MAYPNPILRIRENGVAIVRGGWLDTAAGRHVFQALEDEVLSVRVNYTDILNSETITATADTDGVDVTPTVNAGIVTLAVSNVSGVGDADLTVTFSGGRVMQTLLRFIDPYTYRRDDYYPATMANP